MTEIHEVKCDGCEKTKKLIKDVYYYHSPEKWKWCYDIKKDYCPACYKKYKECLKKCMLSKTRESKK